MMAKALHDGRAFPLRISFALARCICGQNLEFDDLSSIIGHHRLDLLKRLRASISGGPPISEAEWNEKGFDCLDFTQQTFVVQPGSRGIIPDISKVLHLVKGGDGIDVTLDNAAEYLHAFERMYLGDGVTMQIRALQSGFYSVIPLEQVAVLGPSGLLHQLGCLGVPEFDLSDMRDGITPQDPYNTQSPQFLWLFDILKSFDEPNRCAFVRFVTGVPWLASGFQGLKFQGVNKPLTVQLRTTSKDNQPCDDSYHPYAQTCFGLLKLPL